MDRRTFLERSFKASAGAAIGAHLPFAMQAHADLPTLLNSNLLAHFMLLGGPDFRHIFPPAFDPTPNSFGREFFRIRATAYGIDATPQAGEAYWNANFTPVTSNGVNFGMMNGLEWLKTMWDAGNVALVTNVVGAVSRDHAHAQLVWESSDRTVLQTFRPDTGWGGRLADAADGRLFSTTPAPRLFCLHQHPDDANLVGTQRIVTLTDPNNVGLFEPDVSVPDDDIQRGISRALANYYSVKDATVPAGSPHRVFVDHQQNLTELKDLLRPRFDTFTEPALLTSLYAGAMPLANLPIAFQFRSLYYALSAGDLMDIAAVSMAYGSFDSHDNQQEEIEGKFVDFFGSGGAMDTLYQLLPPTVADQVVFVFSGEFGRQLKANGGFGTDHGTGNTVLVIGMPVNGGVYGEMFPEEELDRLDQPTPDIDGRTDVDALFAELAEWVVPGSSPSVFPGLQNARVEQGVNLAGLFV